MRTTPLLLTLLLLGALFAAPTAAAEPQLTDATDDVQVVMTSEAGPLPGAPFAHEENARLDLVSLEGVETEDTIGFRVGLAGMASSVPWGENYRIDFTWNDKDYRVEAWMWTGAPGGLGSSGSSAYLRVREGSDYNWVAELGEMEVDEGTSTFTTHVPKVYIADNLRRTPGRGDSLTALSVTSTRQLNFDVVGMHFTDTMPDEGPSGVITMQLGDFSTGDLVLTTPDRVRVSNGGATTFVFPVTLRNSGEAEHEFTVAVADAPEGWAINAQSPVRVPPKEEKVVSVLASVPFAHEHGGFDAFNVTVQSTRDTQTAGQMRLGVVHTPIPQPAGHHSELFLHAEAPDATNPFEPVNDALGAWRWGWMNTDADHADDGPGMSANGNWNDNLVWWINLNPRLQMGLDFDVELPGEIVGSFDAKRSGETTVAANLYYYRDDGNGGESILLMEGEPTPITITDGTPATFTIPLTALPEADYIPYAPKTWLSLELTMGEMVQDAICCGGNPTTPVLRTEDFKLSLPLNEYHDRLTGAADVAQTLEIVAAGAVEKAGRPGTTLTYAFDVRNTGPETTYVVDLAGNEASLGTLVPAGAQTFAAGETKRITIGVEIPVGSVDGQEIEILLFVHGQDDPSKMAIARTKTVAVTSGEAMPDESATLLAAEAANMETPGAGLVLVLAGVAIALVFARRR